MVRKNKGTIRGNPVSVVIFSILLKLSSRFLARLFTKKTTRYCHSPGIGGVGSRRRAKTLTFSNISVFTEDI